MTLYLYGVALNPAGKVAQTVQVYENGKFAGLYFTGTIYASSAKGNKDSGDCNFKARGTLLDGHKIEDMISAKI